MLRTMLTSKIHRATVTQADLHYVGSVTIDADLMEAAGLLPGEQVAIVDVDNGARLETYAITGPAGSGVIGINGAAAHLVHPGDLVIILAYGQMDDAEARRNVPRVVFVDSRNRITGRGGDPAQALPHDPASRRGDIPVPPPADASTVARPAANGLSPAHSGRQDGRSLPVAVGSQSTTTRGDRQNRRSLPVAEGSRPALAVPANLVTSSASDVHPAGAATRV